MRHPPRCLWVCWLLCAITCALFATPAPAQSDRPEPGDREKALRLHRDHLPLEALPLLEKLHKADPADREVKEALACDLAGSATLLEGEEQLQTLMRARGMLAELQKDGPLTRLGEIFLGMIPPDAKVSKSGRRKEVDDAMREGQRAFAQKRFADARVAYERALALDPTYCAAALFVGDSFFAEGNMADAIPWFERASKIDPNEATVYRYWGDALMRQDKMDEAREKFFRAIVAEPYSQRPWRSLEQWAEANEVRLSHPRILPPDPEPGEPRSVNVEDGTVVMALYDAMRAKWKEELFKKEFPDAKEYRASLREDSEVLHMLALLVNKAVENGDVKSLHPILANLVKLDKEGLLEPHILFARANAGIAQDYEAYRDKNREKLMEYLAKYVAPLPKEARR